MVIDRREVVQGAAASLASLLLPNVAGANTLELYATALQTADGRYAAAIFAPESGLISSVTLPARGHSCVQRPATEECVAFARRPGSFAVSFALNSAKQPIWFAASPGRHFFGHGAFSRDGQLLYSTENDFEGRRGVIGVRDTAAGYRHIGEFPSGGTGPHDISLLPDGRTLVVANGGIETHPDHEREPLNLATMRPNIAYIDSATGDIVERHELSQSQHQLSIRHLCVAMDGRIVIGCQHMGPRDVQPDLVFTHRRGDELHPLTLPEDAIGKLRNYVSSIQTDVSGEFICATSSKGGTALILDINSRTLIATHEMSDVSGVASRKAKDGNFFLTAGTGALREVELQSFRVVSSGSNIAWDNHLLRMM